MRRTVRLATALATTMVLLGACGSSPDSSPVPPATVAPAAAGNSDDAAPTSLVDPASPAAPTAAPVDGARPAASPAPASAAPAPPSAVPAGPSAASALPNTLVHNIADDQFVKMGDFVKPGTPVLVWFWAPH